MSDAQMFAAVLAVLTTVIGWVGARVIVRLDMMVDKLGEVSAELHTRINGVDRRVVRLEAREGVYEVFKRSTD